MTTRLERYVLVVLMAVGSLSIWTAVPLGWILVAGALEISNGLRYLLVLVGAPATMIVAVLGLNRLSIAYEELTDRRDAVRVTLIEKLLAVSALIALVTLIAWWAFGGSNPTPSGPAAPGNEHESR